MTPRSRRILRHPTCALVALLASACTETPVTDLLEEPELQQLPGELACSDPPTQDIEVRVEPSVLVLAPGQRKPVRVVVDPDFCKVTPVTFDASDPSVSSVPEDSWVEYRRPAFEVEIQGQALGTNTVTLDVPTGDADLLAQATLEIHVIEPTLPVCDSADDVAGTTLAGGGRVAAAGSLTGATIAMPEGADAPNEGAFVWSVDPFDASIACAADVLPSGYKALGPAVTFGPAAQTFPRDLPLSIPLNPARMPETSRLRHLAVAYAGPAHREPRVVTVTDAALKRDDDGGWRLEFRAPRLGTYQAVVHPQAGRTTRSRRLTHRAIVGISMGGTGAMQIGLRHHQLFDVVGAMGGPVDWTWLIHHVEHNQLGGFRSIAPGTQLADIPLERTRCTVGGDDCAADETCLYNFQFESDPAIPENGACTLLPSPDEPYEHASTFNTWWYDFPTSEIGHGGDFSREDHTFMFRDLALMYGNPFGYNPEALQLPAGADPTHPAQRGQRNDDACLIAVKPINDHPDEEAQQELFNACRAERCAEPQVLKNYYDDEYNPDGTFDVITFCDGAPKINENTPYANWWVPGDHNNNPVEAGLAVDYNGNGQRDELEPVIRNGHEPYEDTGADGVASVSEPGYGPDNLDPNGDDYDPRYNPNGTENNARYDLGEPYEDFGLDGVEGTQDSPYDFGEGDGQFTAAPGLQRFWDYDARSMVRGRADELLSTPLDDTALARLDFWTDGGTRDLFNFAVSAEHFIGNFRARGRAATVFRHPSLLPGLRPDDPDFFDTAHVVYEDLPGVVSYRYGKEQFTISDLQSGSGQHVGSLVEFTNRLQTALYFIDSRWPDAHRVEMEETADDPDPDALPCELQGNCTIDFTSSFGRTGPVQVTLPPGYAHKDQQHVRYPVIYLLHGYGMTPEDLGPAIVFLANWMNQHSKSQASRLGKFIIVYPDGRCRPRQDGPSECVNGSFFADSPREDGLQLDAWFLELVDHIDANYRTMPESRVEWTE